MIHVVLLQGFLAVPYGQDETLSNANIQYTSEFIFVRTLGVNLRFAIA